MVTESKHLAELVRGWRNDIVAVSESEAQVDRLGLQAAL